MTAVATNEVGMQDHTLPWTEEEYFALGETIARVELFDGSLSVSPSPSHRHQRLLRRLANAFDAAADAVDLEVYTDVNVRLQPARIVEPDLIIRTGVPADIQISEARDIRLICEVTSTNAATDRVLKMHYYATARIPWYLLVEPDEPVLQLYRLDGDHYVLDQQAKPGELLRLTDPVAVELDPATLTG
jgi:Uma2 family endonuclease